jgi:hypothetical protein
MASSDELSLGLEELGQLAKSAAGDFSQLSAAVKSFASSPMIKDKLNANLKNARQLLKGLGGDFDQLGVVLKGVGVKADDVKRVIKTLGDEGRRAGGVFKDFWKIDGITNYLHHLRGVSLAQRAVVGGVGGVLSKGIEESKELIHKVVELGGEAEASQKGLSYILSGGAEEGTAEHARGEDISKHMMGEFLKLAKRTPIADRDIVAAGKDFATALSGSGRSMEEVEKISLQLVKVMADQQSKFLEDSSVRRNFINAVTRGMGKTTASLQDLNSLRVAKFNIGAILEQLPYQKGIPELMKQVKGGKFKVTPEDLEKARETVGEGEISSKELENMAKMQKLISMAKSAGTPIAYSTLFNAAQASIYKGKDVGKAAGGLAEFKAAHTLIGAVNNATNAFDNLILGMDFAGSKGGVQLRDFLNRFNAVIGESGTLKAAVTNFTDALFEPLAKLTGKDMEHLVDMAAKAGQAVGNAIKQIWEWIQKLLEAKPGELLKNTKDVLIQAGTLIGQGLLKGVSIGAAEATGYGRYSSTVQGSSGKAWGNLWEDTGGAAANWLYEAIAPSSRESEERSSDAPPAWVENIPHNARGGRYTSPTLAVVGEAGPETVVPDGMSLGRGGVSVTIPIQVVNASGMDADDLAGALQPLIMREFNNIFQRGAAELGAGE